VTRKSDNDFNLSWGGNKKTANKTWTGKGKVCISARNLGQVDLKDRLLQPYLLERKKVTKWYIKMFRRLLNVTILNCMIICYANSGYSKTDHFKFRAVQALLIEHGSEIERKVQGCHSTDKNVPRLLE
jgi:hypothetical protein